VNCTYEPNQIYFRANSPEPRAQQIKQRTNDTKKRWYTGVETNEKGVASPARSQLSNTAPTLVDESILYIAPSSLRALPLVTVGSCPSGFMNRNARPISYRLFYEIPNGIQATFHCNPGHPYQGTTRVAYLPNDNQGHHLLVCLKSAWNSGLIFTIGTSLSWQCNAVTWSTILQDTSLHSGPFGYPDPGYVPKCNASLDALQVPWSKRHKVQKCISYFCSSIHGNQFL
jgi:hypothetical protein